MATTTLRARKNIQSARVSTYTNILVPGNLALPSVEIWTMEDDPSLLGVIDYSIANIAVYDSDFLGKYMVVNKVSETDIDGAITFTLPAPLYFSQTGTNTLPLPRRSTSFFLCFSDSLVSVIYGESLPSSQFYTSSARVGIDPTSNPDPLSGGLIVTAAQTAAFNYYLPLTFDSVLGGSPSDNYVDDPDLDFEIVGGSLQVNRPMTLEISMGLWCLSNAVSAPAVTAQLFPGAGVLFMNPPMIASADQAIPVALFNPLFPFAYLNALSSVAFCKIESAPVILNLGFFTSEDIVVSLTSNLSVKRISLQ